MSEHVGSLQIVGPTEGSRHLSCVKLNGALQHVVRSPLERFTE